VANIAIEWRYANAQFSRALKLAEELVQLSVDVIAKCWSAKLRKPPMRYKRFTGRVHERGSAFRREKAHCRSLISHSRLAVSESCASGLGGVCS
jgi:hypothetical protein